MTTESGWTPPTPQEELEILRSTRTIAIVGMSDDPGRASHSVASYLLSSSCRFEHVWFVNPKGGEILGRPVYRSLAELPEVPDLVDVFRRSSALPDVAREVVALGGVKTFWAQLGLHSDEAVDIVTRAGIRAVTDRCLKIEHARLADRLDQPAADPGERSSRRTKPL